MSLTKLLKLILKFLIEQKTTKISLAVKIFSYNLEILSHIALVTVKCDRYIL